MNMVEIPKAECYQRLKTIKYVCHNLFRQSTPVDSPTTYWDKTSQQTFNRLIDQDLSNPNDPERLAIKVLLKDFQVASVLDAGCGPATEFLSYQSDPELSSVKYIGVDKSDRMLELAKDRYPEALLVKADLKELPFPDKSVDAVVLKHVLEHQPDGYEKVVAEAVRLATQCVIIDFFHAPLRFIPKTLRINDRNGYTDNWYNRTSFEGFLDNLPITNWKAINSMGNRGQRAVIYALTVSGH